MSESSDQYSCPEAENHDEQNAELNAILHLWHDRLSQWARSGRLGNAAQIALRLDPDHQGLQSFVRRIAENNVQDLPGVICRGPEAMEDSPGAYCADRKLILLNSDWLGTALEEQVVALLCEQLGHHLDVLFNQVDTPGDEGELFLECLRSQPSKTTVEMYRKTNEEAGIVHLEGEDLVVDEAGVGAICLDLRDLS